MTASQPRELSAKTVQQLLHDGKIQLIDVREPQEYQSERIEGAISMPLSSFDPKLLPVSPAVPIVFHCGIGKRSLMAVNRCFAEGIDHDTHMSGGLQAWKTAGLPTIRG